MEVLIWIGVIFLFILSFIGLIVPIIPGVGLIWGGVALYHFLIDSTSLTWLSWGSFALLTIVLLVTDQVAAYYFVKKTGGSKIGSIIATIGVIIGVFVMPPFGIIIVPFVLVIMIEILQQKPISAALDIALGTVIAFFSGTVAKALFQIIMIGIFIIDIIV